MKLNHQSCIGTALKTVQHKARNGQAPQQAIKVNSFMGFVKYLNDSNNWLRNSEGWKNSSGQLTITNGVKGFILHRID